MGWRGVMRSVGASQRRAQRASQQHLNRLEKAERSVDRTVGRMDAEVERDLDKVRRAEERIAERPVSGGGLSYDQETDIWSLKPLSDQTGALVWKLEASFPSAHVAFGPGVIENGSRGLTPLAFAAARWGIFVAFELSALGAGRKPKKLVGKSDPSKGLVFLRSGSKVIAAMDGDVDRPALGDGIGVIAFPLPEAASVGTTLWVEFQIGDTPQVVEVTAEDLHDIIARANRADTLVDAARKQLQAQLAPVRQEADQAKKKIASAKNSGCGLLILILVVITIIVGALR